MRSFYILLQVNELAVFCQYSENSKEFKRSQTEEERVENEVSKPKTPHFSFFMSNRLSSLNNKTKDQKISRNLPFFYVEQYTTPG